MLKELDDYDWEQAFELAGAPEAACPGLAVETGPFTRDDVKRIVALVEGENDGPDWVGVFQLRDSRYVTVVAGCDYTGWG